MKLLIFILLNFVCKVLADESCPVTNCTCNFDHIVCRHLSEPLNLTLFNKTVNKIKFENTIINETIFTPDSDVQNLLDLSFESCNFSSFDLERMQSLEYLQIILGIDLEKLKLVGVPLKNLDLTQNDLKDEDLVALGDILKNLPYLEKLDISNNKFTSIDASIFSSLDNLRVLEARECDIEYIYPSELNAHLEEVDFSDNKLSDVPDAIFKSSSDSLQTLSLIGNPLQQISLNFSQFSSLKSLALEGVKVNCSCDFMKGLPERNVIEPFDLKCHDFEKHVDGSVQVVDFLTECQSQKNGMGEEEEGSSKSLVIVIIFLVVVTVIAVVGCLVHRVLSNRRRRAQEKKAVRYSAVYRETVESSMPSSRTTVDTKA